MTTLTPAIFFGHGNPLNAITKNEYSEGWATIGRSLPRPKGIVSISAHWYIPQSAVTVAPTPRTIHDFGGFPEELYDVNYPAPGDPKLAWRVRELLSPLRVELDESWGLDHGTWAVLMHVFPKADIPVVQLSIDERQPPEYHYEAGKKLAALREEGILVIGSGNLVHNLHTYAWGRQGVKPFDWAVRFETRAKEFMIRGEDSKLVAYEKLGQDAMLSAPTPDHYLPLLYILGLRRPEDQVSFPVEGVDGGSVSMLAVQVG
jgi:4,5-DOPA dioxygenase extradiol